MRCTVYSIQCTICRLCHVPARSFRPFFITRFSPQYLFTFFFRRLASPVSRRKRNGVFHRVKNFSTTLNRRNRCAISLKVLPRHCNSGSMYSMEFLLRTLKNLLELERVKFPSLPPVARSRQCFPVIFTQNPRTLPSYVLILTRSIQIIMLQGRKLIIKLHNFYFTVYKPAVGSSQSCK